MLVLVADPEQEYGEMIGELLRRQSHRVVLAAGADSLRRFLDSSSADMLIVSAALADRAPADLVREIRCKQDAPIILLVDRCGSAELAACFDAGADDCVRKPFHPGEFAARVGAVARRACARPLVEIGEAPVTSLRPRGATLTGSGLEFDHGARRAYYNAVDLQCSQLEYQILHVMAQADGQVLTYAFLNEQVWGYPNLSDGTLLKGHISSIRGKLRSAGFEDQLIRTVYGVGYALSTRFAEGLTARIA